MPGIEYIYVPLENASLIQRKHDREVVPPGFVTLKNFISSRSDNVPTLRSNIVNASAIKLAAYRTLLGDLSLTTEDEYLNSAFGLYGGENLIFLTTRFPIDNSTDVTLGTYSGIEYSTIISKLVDSGTATAAVTNDSDRVVISDPTEINMNQKSWYGACIKFDGHDAYYPIRIVSDKENVVLETPADFTDATVAFKVLQSHCPQNTDYKFHTELFLSNSIYNTPIFDVPFSTQRMSGPFVGNITTEVDYIGYSGEFTEFTEAQSANFQNETQTEEYNSEMISRKYCASGNAIFMTTKPFYVDSENVGDITHAGPYYTITPDILSSYLPPIEGGAGDIFSVLPLDTNYATFWNRSFSRGKIIFNGTNKFYIPVVAYKAADVPNPGDPADYKLAIIEFADDATPTTVGYLTDYSLGATEPQWCITNICYDSANNYIILSTMTNQSEVSQDPSACVNDEIIVIETSTWTTSTLTLPTPICCFGLEYSATAGGFLATGLDATNSGVAMFYDTSWTTLTNPAGTIQYYGSGIYDDGVNWVFTITGNSKLFYWGVDDSTTVVDTGSEFSTDLNLGAFRCASNGFVYDPLGTPTYSKTVVLSAHNKVGIALVDTDGSTTVAFSRLLEEHFEDVDNAYIGKFQRPIFYTDQYEVFVTTGTTGHTGYFGVGVGVIDAEPGVYVNYYVDEFTPISDLYRSKCFGVVNGYVVLFGLLEYDADNDEWDYTPRRIRWTAPATVSDFSGDGSGTADVLGNGEFIDARTINERIVMFETNAISTLVPRGIVDDPFDYEVIHRGIRVASNPCVVNDICYFIANDGLIYSTNGVIVEELGAAFDLTAFDDFDEKSPAWLIYSPELNSLLVFYPNSTTSTVYSISMANGTITSLNILDYSNAYPLKSIVCPESSSNISMYFSYNPQPSAQTYDEVVSVSKLETGEAIDGVDGITFSNNSGYWYAELETGNLFNDRFPEGIKIALKHIIIHTYTDSTDVTYNPDIIVEVKSLEDSTWSSCSDDLVEDVISVSSTTASISSSAPTSAFSNLLGSATGSAVTYDLPWNAANCRVYTKTGSTYTACTLVTTTPTAVNTYQISDTKEIKVVGTNGHEVYCYCENEPSIKVKTGDYVLGGSNDDELLRITAIPTYRTLTLYDNIFNNLTTCSHRYAEQIPIGRGSVKVGINKLVEGVKIRIFVVPRVSQNTLPSIVKITGISLGYVPLGEKILEATGG